MACRRFVVDRGAGERSTESLRSTLSGMAPAISAARLKIASALRKVA